VCLSIYIIKQRKIGEKKKSGGKFSNFGIEIFNTNVDGFVKEGFCKRGKGTQFGGIILTYAYFHKGSLAPSDPQNPRVPRLPLGI